MNTVPYKQIWRTWRFKSSSSNKSYETILYDDLTTSCDCFGWCRRVEVGNKRYCKHTRMVEIGIKDMVFTLADGESVGKYVNVDLAVLNALKPWIPVLQPYQKVILGGTGAALLPKKQSPPPNKKDEPPQPPPVPLRKLNRGYKP